MKYIRVNMVLTDEIRRWLMAERRRTGDSASRIIRDLVKAKMEQSKSKGLK